MKETPKRSWLWICVQIISWIGSTLLFDLKAYGKRNIPRRGGVLMLSNHQSVLDPLLLPLPFFRPVSFMAKSELFEKHPSFVRLIRAFHAFPVRRGQGDVGAIKEAINILKDGNILNIFPEGTRSLDGRIGPILPGVVVVVRRAGVPVIPVIIDGSFRALRKGTKGIRGCPVRIMYGKPLDLDGLKSQEIVALIDKTLHEMMEELQRKDAA